MFIPLIHFIQEDEQLFVESFTQRKVINGPGRYIAQPFEKVKIRDGIRVAPTEFLRLINRLNGEYKIVRGPCLYFLEADEDVLEHLDALTLTEDQYAYIIEGQTGEIRSIRGPQLYVPQPTEQIVEKLDVLTLKENQYVRILNRTSGQMRIVRGENTVILEPNEQISGKRPETGINIDEETAIIVRDITTGQRRLITEPQVFIPQANQEIVDVQKRIRLEDHEVVIIKDKDGRYIFRQGQDEDRSFFLDPYSELVTMRWASGLHKERRELELTHIDIRPKYMWYEFEVRTKDNVELIIGITFFWQIVDVQAMIRMTDDTPGDLCSHARSTIIQAVSKVTLETFLDSFNSIVRDATLGVEEDEFYSQRGTQINAVEVRSVTCKDPQTQEILMEIIQETTNRLNRLQKQESENEVRLKHLQGEIEAENARGELLETRREHTRTEALTQGESEAERVRQFFIGLGDELSMDQKVAIYNVLRKGDMLDVISRGNASLYFTPADVNLSIETNN